MRMILVAVAMLAFEVSGKPEFFSGSPTNAWAPGQPGFDFYKLCLTWQPSACYSPGKKCGKTPIEMFTTHGLWPHRDVDVAVPPYNADHSCTTTTTIPTPETKLQASLVSIPQTQLKTNWPTLFMKTDLEFWKHEWVEHGMCSDYPTDPATYFKSALNLHQKFNNLPTVLGITLGQRYKAGDVLEKVKAKFNAYPQIACNNKVSNNAQLWEIRFCYERTKPPTILQNCPTLLAVCDNNTQIVLPNA